MTDENTEPAVSKTGSVRDRIAEVLCEDGQRPMHTAMRLADAVIRELGLERQDHYDPDCDYYRYATDWIAPNA